MNYLDASLNDENEVVTTESLLVEENFFILGAVSTFVVCVDVHLFHGPREFHKFAQHVLRHVVRVEQTDRWWDEEDKIERN